MSVQSGEQLPLPRDLGDDASITDVALPGGAYRANLYVFDPSGRISWYALTPRSFAGGRYFTLGRAPGCDIVLADASISARHACIAAGEHELLLRDLGSTNGTLLNDEPVREAGLRHGDVLRFGATDIRFLLSDRRSPVQLVLDFVDGPNAGKTIPAFGASTTIGRLNCGVNLQGVGVAPQHARIDAYGRDLVFVATLKTGAETWLNDQRVRGVVPARLGDRLRIGPHEILLRVTEDSGLLEEIPRGAGTLLVGEAPGLRGANPAVQMSSDQMRALRQRLDDSTVADTRPPAEVLLAPTDPPELTTRREPTIHPEVPRRLVPAKRARKKRRWLRWVAPPLVIGAMAGAAALVPVPRTLELSGVLAAGEERPLPSPVRGRLEKVYFRPGDKVVAGDPVAWVADLEVQAELDRLAAEERGLEGRLLGKTQVVEGEVPPSVLRQIEDAETEVKNASQVERLRDQEFNERRATIDALETARRAVQTARVRADALRREAEAARSRRRVVSTAPDAGAVAKLEDVLRRRAALEGRLRVQVTAPASGVLVADPAPREGQAVTRGESLFVIADLSRLHLRARVPGAWLGAVEGRDRAVLTPEGFPDRRLDIALGGTSPVADADGAFTLEARVPNPDGALRAGQHVRLSMDLPDTNALAWLWNRLADR